MFYPSYVLALDPIAIKTNYAPQNDCLDLSFVKYFNVVGEKKPKMIKK